MHIFFLRNCYAGVVFAFFDHSRAHYFSYFKFTYGSGLLSALPVATIGFLALEKTSRLAIKKSLKKEGLTTQ